MGRSNQRYDGYNGIGHGVSARQSRCEVCNGYNVYGANCVAERSVKGDDLCESGTSITQKRIMKMNYNHYKTLSTEHHYLSEDQLFFFPCAFVLNECDTNKQVQHMTNE